MAARPYFFDLTPDALRAQVTAWGLPGYRARQVLDWVYRRHVIDPAAMSNLGQADRDLLRERLRFTSGAAVRQQVASDGVQKLLLEWGEGDLQMRPRSLPPTEGQKGGSARQTECVMIPAGDWERGGEERSEERGEESARERRTACISSQVGCPVGCAFCASGLGGLDANLGAGQMVEQVWRLAALPGVGRITHVVFMGMGEPLANFEQVTRAVTTLMADWGLGISGRRITISTVGLPAPMRRLADLDLPITLAISLHAPTDDLRQRIIPWARRVTIAQLIAAGRYYFERTGREVTLEYILLHEVNDQPEHARQLAAVARQLRSNVNLIRYNEVAGLPFARPADRDVRRFQEVLREAGVNTHIRASRGRDIAAACGQLRHEAREVAERGVVREA